MRWTVDAQRRIGLAALMAAGMLGCDDGRGAVAVSDGGTGGRDGDIGVGGNGSGGRGVGGGGGGGGRRTEVALDNFLREFQRAFCARLVACGQALDQATCEATLQVDQLPLFPESVAAVKRGTMTYDAARAAECLPLLLEGCDLLLDPVEACAVFAGTLPSGATCSFALECAQGLCASRSACGMACCPGTCEIVVPIGGDCSPAGTRCATGAYCRPDDKTCAALLPVGSPCSPAGACQLPAFCAVPTGSAAGTCLPLPAEGAPCGPATGQTLCADIRDYCDSAAATCTRRRGPGATCAADGDCVLYASCIAGTCQVDKLTGEACDEAGATAFCMNELECVGGVCALPAPRTICPGR